MRVAKYLVNEQQAGKARYLEIQKDQDAGENNEVMDRNDIVFEFDAKQKGKKISFEKPLRVKKAEVKQAHKALRNAKKANKNNAKEQKEKEKIEKIKQREDSRRAKAQSKEKEKKKPKEKEEAPKKKQEKKVVANRAERAKKRQRKGQESDEDEEQIDTGEKKGPKRKRDEKAAEKQKIREMVIKKKEPQQLREDVAIPEIISEKELVSDELEVNCCQSCANRNCLRAVFIDSAALFESCIKQKAHITSLIEHPSPELRFSALEKAIANNRLAIIEMFLSQKQSEKQGRMKKRDVQIVKFDTGEVGKMAFGVKVRKVNQMRGNRQGNNAFVEDPTHEHETPRDYLLNSGYCMEKIFWRDTVEKETLKVLRDNLGNADFDAFVLAALPHMLSHGCYKALVGLLELVGTDQDPGQSIYSKEFYELLTCDALEKFTIGKEHLQRASQNRQCSPAHFAALNPSGAGLNFMKAQGEEINIKMKKVTVAHMAAVCNTMKNLEILEADGISFHEEDETKQTPLHWAIKAGKGHANLEKILEELDYSIQKNAKNDQKLTAIHYLGKFGCQEHEADQVIDTFMKHKINFTQVGGWDKYTPLEYAATYGQFEVLRAMLASVPKININKGDKYDRSPLVMACRNGHARIVAELIRNNADLNKPDNSGNSPLHHAAAYGWHECVQLLITHGADPSPENAWKTTPIVVALQKNHVRVVKELLKVKEKINADAKDDEGRTLLILSMANVNQGTLDLVSLLLDEKKADPNIQDAKGRTALYQLVHNIANKKKGLFNDFDDLEFKLVKILMNGGAQVQIKAKDEKSPFTLAFEYGISELLKVFGLNLDLNQDPTLFFALQGSSILKIQTHKILEDCLKSRRLEDECINFVSDQGFTPFLFYIHQFCLSQQRAKQAIRLLLQNGREATNALIIEEMSDNAPQMMMNQGNENEVERIFKQEISKPFIDFLTLLLENGANPNAYVLKLKEYREEPVHSGATQSQQIQARRPPEKQQYVSEELGLCNCVNLLIFWPNKELFEFLLGVQGLELNQVSLQNMTPFFRLVKHHDIKLDPYYKFCFQKLLDSGQVDINAPDQFGNSAFWHFYINKKYDDAWFLVEKGADVNHIDNYGSFALKREFYAQDLQLMKAVLEKNADPNKKDEFGRTCLHLSCNSAVKRDQMEFIKLLMTHKADIGALDFKNRSPLYYMFVQKNRRYEASPYDPLNNGLQLILNAMTIDKIDINAQDVNGKSLLHYAAQRGSVQSLEYFVQLYTKEKLDFNLVDKWMNTPLSIALTHRHLEFVKTVLALEVADMKGFIYEEPRAKGQANNNIQAQLNRPLFGGQNQQMDQQDLEASDFEFMDVQQDNLGQQPAKRKHNKDEALNLFRYIIRQQLGEYERLFVEREYDKIQMIIDYICEGQINKLFQLIETHFKQHEGAKGSILIQKNEKEQNLIHVLARNAHRINQIGEVTKFYKQLLEEHVDPFEQDYKGRTTLMLGAMSGNLAFLKYLCEVEKVEVAITDNRGGNSINSLLKGDRILKASPKTLEYLIQQGVDPDCLYEEPMYAEDREEGQEEEKEQKKPYKATALIHGIRHEHKDRANIQEVLRVLLKHANLSAKDSEGRDAFMYIAMRNHYNTFNFILNTIEEHKKEIVKDSVDLVNGKTFVHYIVNPIEYGSYENQQLLKKALEMGFVHDVKDNKGKTPYQYACEQSSGILKQVFHDFGYQPPNQNQEEKKEEKKEDEEMKLEDLVGQAVMTVDFEKDAHEYLHSIQMQIDPTNSVPCDPLGKFNEDCEVIFDEDTGQHFDAYMTRVEIGKFQPGGDYLFYRMQLVRDRGRDLCMLLTRWGRIGEDGAFQKTPFSNKEEAVVEFKKVFEQKTNNKWVPKDKFKKSFRKFQIMRTNYVTLDQQNFIAPFTNLDQSPALKVASKEVVEVMREICDVDTYLKALKNSGVDPKAMPFSNLHRKNLYDALEVLQKVEKTLVKLSNMNPRPYAESERNTLLSLREKMWFLSSRFYECIPHEEFRNKMVPPISTLDMLGRKSQMLQSLIDIEQASKILLGAHGKSEEYHPLEYCLLATGAEMVNLVQDEPEFKLINQYVANTTTNRRGPKVIRILKISREQDNKKFKKDFDNKMLLFHGSKISNFLSLLSQGMKVQPIQVQRQGNLLGRGIYFSDVFSKALSYTNDQNAPQHTSKFVLVCEVALGESKQMMRIQPDAVISEDFQSLTGAGRSGPEKKKFITLPDGVRMPCGKLQNYNNANGQGHNVQSDFEYNEYVVSDADQVRLRYLVQLK